MTIIQNRDTYLKTFRLNGIPILYEDIILGKIDLTGRSEFELTTLNFIKDWLSGGDFFVLKTSGSTGKPKTLKIAREQLVKSAIRTVKLFELQQGQTILSSLDSKFVAGIMMIVRAIECKLNLVIIDPARLLKKINNELEIKFCVLTPYQVEAMLKETPQSFANIHTILIGGAAINPALEEQIKHTNVNVFHSYAMTETLSHVALRKVNGHKKAENYHAIEGVTFSLDKRGCLIINDQILNLNGLITNDLVELIDERSFKWIGRIDNVINSGGIKIQVEDLENKIEEILRNHGVYQRFCILSIPDEKLTSKIVLLIERSEKQIDDIEILDLLKQNLAKYHDPKSLIIVAELLLTRTGKIDRIGNAKLYLSNMTRHKR